jgi:hypothetical protein
VFRFTILPGDAAANLDARDLIIYLANGNGY